MASTARSHRRRAHTLRSRRKLTAIGVPSAVIALAGVAFAAGPAIAANPSSTALPFPTVCASTQAVSSSPSASATSSSASPSASATSSTPKASASSSSASAKAQAAKTTAPATGSGSSAATTSSATGGASASASPSASASASATNGGFWGWLNGIWTWITGAADTTSTKTTVVPAVATRTTTKAEPVSATTSAKASSSSSSKSDSSSKSSATTAAAAPSATTSSATPSPSSTSNCISSASAAALAAKAAADGTAEGVYANTLPWVMKTSTLTMYDLTYNGVKTVQVWNGSAYEAESVLDFTASKLTIASMVTYSIQGGQTVYNNAGSGTTTTLTDPHLMVTKMEASLFGLIPQTYTPTNQPPLPVGLTVPLIPIVFTGVTTQIAYLHTDGITIPGFDGYAADGTASPQ